VNARATAAKLATSVPFLWVAIAAVTVLAFGLLIRRPPKSSSLIPPETRRELDSLKASGAKDRASIDSLRAYAAAAQTRGTSAVAHASVIVTRSRADAHLADSLAAEARKSDSASMAAQRWQLAYDARTRQAEELGKAVDSLLVAHREDSTAIALGKGAFLISQARNAHLEHLVPELEAIIAKQERGCRVLGFITCPSRKMAFVGGVSLGLLGGAITVAVMRP
jgi:hypothetical protein